MSLNLEKTLPISVKCPESKARKEAVVFSKRSSLLEKMIDSEKSPVRILELRDSGVEVVGEDIGRKDKNRDSGDGKRI